MGMRQLFDPVTSTCTYLLWDKDTDDAILVDPVDSTAERDLRVATGLHLVYAVNTHCHEDHVSGTRSLKRSVRGLQSVISTASGAQADERIGPGDEIHFGRRFVTALATPGHTAGCLSFLLDDGKAILTGDALLIGGCGRCDLPGGSAETLYDSVRTQLFRLSDDVRVFPGHDYDDQRSSTIGKEKAHNPQLGGGTSKEEFVRIMNDQKLPRPKLMDVAVPANLEDGGPPFFVRSLRSRIKQRWGVFG